MTNPAPAERWKPVPGYSGFYEISSEGRVRGLPQTRWSGTSTSRSNPARDPASQRKRMRSVSGSRACDQGTTARHGQFPRRTPTDAGAVRESIPQRLEETVEFPNPRSKLR